MAVPTVAIIGRPNVGKSSLLNALAGEMISIVEPTAGVTRDRVSALIQRGEKYIELIDTGGYGIVDEQKLSDHIEEQIRRAIDTADLIVFMTDIRQGIVPLDKQIAGMLRKQNLEVIGIANKADEAKFFAQVAEFSQLGLGEFMPISATNNINKADLLDRIDQAVQHIEYTEPAQAPIKIALAGKRNAGKSTLLNAIVQDDRVIVSETPGTTRDAVDVRFAKNGRDFVIIDTAGVRKKRKLADSIEFYSYTRVTRSIKRAEVIFFTIDATLPVSQVDKKLAHFVSSEYKSCILVINKWDLVDEQAEPEEFEDYLSEVLPGLRQAPIVFTTATTRENVDGLLNLAVDIYTQSNTQIPTAKLNKAFDIIKTQRPPSPKKPGGGKPKIYYATQIAVNPITILMFVNRPGLFDQTLMRYIRNKLQELLPIDEVPVRLLVRPHRKTKNE